MSIPHVETAPEAVVPETDTPEVDMLEVISPILGRIRIPASETFTFDQGLLGFPENRTFILIPAKRPGAFWLQSTDHPPLTFLLVDPFEWVEDFSIDIPEGDLGPLTPDEAGDLVVLAILTLRGPERDDPTVNLQGPIALNIRKRRGRQIVVQDSEWGTRWPVKPLNTRLAS